MSSVSRTTTADNSDRAFRKVALEDHLHIRLFDARVVSLEAGYWRHLGVRNNFWRFYANPGPGAFVDTAHGRTELTPDVVVFVPARVRFDCDNEGHVEHLYAHFDLVGLSPHSPAFDRPLVLTRDPSMSRALVELGSDLRRGGPTLAAQLKVKSILFQALARLMESLSPEETERQRRINAKLEPIEPALRRIDGDVSRRWTVGELAKSCNLSESHFARLFREALGQTPAAYATERRVAEAARLLLFTDLSVEQVAAQTGFPNRFHFSRVFAEAMGEGPATYRRRTPP